MNWLRQPLHSGWIITIMVKMYGTPHDKFFNEKCKQDHCMTLHKTHNDYARSHTTYKIMCACFKVNWLPLHALVP